MKLDRYDVTFTVSNPADPEQKVSVKFGECERARVLAGSMTRARAVIEAMVHEFERVMQ